MPSLDDPEFVEALEKLFATRSDIRAIADYQRKLYDSLVALHSSHRDVHERVRTLTDTHRRGQDGDSQALERARRDLERLLKDLEVAHEQTRREVRAAAGEINRLAQELRKIPLLESRLDRLEREVERQSQVDRQGDRKDDEHDRLLREEARRNQDQEERIRRLERELRR